MAFDPTLPVDASEIAAPELRAQFTGLAELIAAQEVRIAALEAGLAGTARDPVSEGPFTVTLSDPPSAAQVQAILDVHNSLVQAVKRA